MGRPCSICCDGERYRLAGEMIASGATDQAIADRMGGVNRTAVSRHRHNHVIAPAKAIAQAASKGQDVAGQRADVMTAAAAGNPAAWVSMPSIVTDLQRVHDRLERTADGAEQDKQRLVVASLSAQQLRASEVRAKLGNVGGYAPGKARPDGGAMGLFSVNIHLGNGQVQRITTAAGSAPGRVFEGDVEQDI